MMLVSMTMKVKLFIIMMMLMVMMMKSLVGRPEMYLLTTSSIFKGTKRFKYLDTVVAKVR